MIDSSNITSQIVFIDSKVSLIEALTAGVLPGIETVILSSKRDGIAQITAALSRKSYSTVHIVSHGSPGCLHLGNSQLNLATIDRYIQELKTWFFPVSLSPSVPISQSPSLLLYGCNVAKGDRGRDFLNKLKTIVGAEITASSTPIGHQSLGGNWELDVSTAKYPHQLAFTPETQQSYAGAFNDISGKIFSDDTNNDGTIGDGDTPLANVLVELFSDPNGDGDRSDGTSLGTTLTNSEGFYKFTGIPDGDYVVEYNPPNRTTGVIDADGGDTQSIAVKLPIIVTAEELAVVDITNNAAVGTTNSLVGSSGLEIDFDIFEVGTAQFDRTLGFDSSSGGAAIPYGFLIQFSDVADGNSFTAGSETISGLVADDTNVQNYVIYRLSFNQPTDISGFTLSDFDTDYENVFNGSNAATAQGDAYHDTAAVIVRDDLGNFSSPTPDTLGAEVETFNADLVNSTIVGGGSDPNFDSLNASASNPFALTGIRHPGYTLPDNTQGTSPYTASSDLGILQSPDNSVGFATFSSIQDASEIYVVYWNGWLGEDNRDATTPDDGQGISIFGNIDYFQDDSVGNDFLLETIYNLSGTVYEDTNNPLADSIEPTDTPVAGVTVQLFADDGNGNPTGSAIATEVTDVNGFYNFDSVVNGSYIVVQTQPSNLGSIADIDGTDDNQIAVTISGGDSTGNDFLEEQKVAIGSTVFADANNNGIQDLTESGISGVSVELYDPGADGVVGGVDDVLVDTTTTDSNGNYLFSDLSDGDYYVSIPSSNFNSGGALENNPISSSNTATTDDGVDGDDNGIQTTVRDATNSPVINLTANSEPLDTGTETAPGNSLDNALDDADGDMTVDFGFAPVYSVSGTVYEDTNNPDLDAINATDSPLPGVVVTLYGADDTSFSNPLATATTDVNGFYEFADLPNGDYVIIQTQPGDYDSVTDSDPSTVDNRIDVTVAGANLTDNNFLEEKVVSIGSTVFADTNNNGIQDPTESGISNVTVELYDPGTDGVVGGTDDVLVDSTTTDSNGNYIFSNLPEGDYYVSIPDTNFAPGQPLENSSISSDNTSTSDDGIDGDNNGIQLGGAGTRVVSPVVDLTTNSEPVDTGTETAVGNSLDNATDDADGDMTVDFGFVPVYSVSGTVYEDTNDPDLDAIDATDSPLPGISLTIYGADDTSFSNPLATATTDVNGFYEFTDLLEGNYVVVQTQPNDLGSVTDADGIDDNQIAITLSGTDSIGNDFLEQEIVALGSTVFADTDNDGIQDPTEAGISGVTVELYDPGANGVVGGGDDVLLSTQTTDSNGNYLFSDLAEGDYYVSIPDTNFDPGQALENTPVSSTTTSVGDNQIDGDDNGIQTGGVRARTVSPIVNLTPTSEPIDTGTETANGNNLDNLAPGVNDSDGDMTVDFGFAPVYGLSGTVYEDTNNPNLDAIDATDSPVPGVTISLYEAGNLSIPIATTVTDSNGFYEFLDLLNGDYIVIQTQPTDYDSVTDTDPSTVDNRIDVTVAGANSTDNNFLEEKSVSLGSTVYADTNNNGIQDPTESGISGVTVELYDPGNNGVVGGGDDEIVGTTTTDSNGNYLFSDLPEGDYYVSIPDTNFNPGQALANNTISSTTTSTTDDGVDGDDNGIQATTRDTTNSPVINLTANSEPVDTGTETAPGNSLDNGTDDADGDMTVDFGFVPVYSVSGMVYEDTNNPDLDTIDATDSPIPGITVSLYEAGNLSAPIATTVTDSNGFYEFTDLLDGNYVIIQTQPTDYDSVTDSDPSTVDNRIDVTVAGSNSVANNFLEEKVVSIGSTVYADTNNNGIQDPTETGISGVAVELYDPGADGVVGGTDDVLVDSTTTDSNGNYLFDSLPEGDYYVSIPDTNFNSGQPLENNPISSTTTSTTDDGVDGDDNGIQATVRDATTSPVINLTANAEPVDTGTETATGNSLDNATDDADGDMTVDFGFAPVYSVSGNVYEDTNDPDLDAIDATDSPIPGVSLTIYGADDTSFSNPLATATTDVNGFYEFTDLPDGDYVVVQTQPGDYDTVRESDSVADNQITVTITGANSTDNNFLEEKVVSLGSTVFEDINNNGIQDPTEAGISGVTVELYDPGADGVVGGTDDVLVDSTTTDSNGNYLFSNLPEGDYYVSIPDTNFNPGQALANNTISSATTSTTDDGVDGDDNGIQATTGNTTNSPVINLTANSEPVDTGTETAPGNSLDNALDDADGDMTVDFGFVPVYSVSGNVYEDTNNPSGDGIDATDSPIPGVSLTIYGADDTSFSSPLATATTDVNGFYEFTDLLDGDYVIIQTQPGDYDSVTDSDPSTVDNRIDVTVAGASLTDNNFLEEKVVSIGSTVYADTNNNGIQDPTESGISNVTVELYDPGADGVVGGTDDVLIDSTTTDSNGNYLFSDLPEGNYYASIPSSNFDPGQPLENNPISSTTTSATDDGVDGDDNGIQATVRDATTSPVINLTANSEPIDTGTETAPGNSLDNALDDADGDMTVDFGFAPVSSVSGTVYEDTNNPDLDAIDATDSPIPGVLVTLYAASDTSFSSPLATATTDVNGAYQFADLPDGDYVIIQTQPTDYDSVTDSDLSTVDNRIDVTVAGASLTDNNFLEEKVVSLGSTIFEDANDNGIQDPTETGISGVAVELYSPGGNGVVGGGDDVLIDSTTTDSNGNYLFSDLPEGDYYVSIPDTNFNPGQPLENNPISSTTTSVGDNQIDGDDNGIQTGGVRTTTVSPIVNLTANSEPIDTGTETAVGNSLDNGTDDADGDMTLDFGFVSVYSVSGNVYEDTNNPELDAIDATDSPIPGVTVSLYEAGNLSTPVATTVTDSNGFYQFEDLPNGDYVIIQTQPGDYDSVADSDPSTVDNRIDVTVAGVNSTDNNFLEEKSVSLGSTVFADANNNGIQDHTESGISGVAVELYTLGNNGFLGGGDDVLVDSTTTDSNGNYLFDSLPEGDYYVSIPDTNFDPGQALANSSISSDNTSTTDDGVDGDDNGIQFGGAGTRVISPVINLTANSEPVDTGTETAPGNTIDNATDDADGDMTVDFGFVSVYSVSGTVYEDTNNPELDAIDATDSPIPGVTISLYEAGNLSAPIATTVTDSNGFYEFAGLLDGNYVIIQTQPGDYDSVTDSDPSTVDNRIDVTVAGASLTNNNFLEEKVVSIGSTVYADTNNNGIQDLTESGIANVTVELYDPGADGIVGGTDDVLVDSTTTDSNGNYLFSDLPEGDYYVSIPDTNFNSGQPLENNPISSTTTSVGDDQIDGDDNGIQTTVRDATTSPVINLTANAEPIDSGTETAPGNTIDNATDDADGDMTVDFGFAPVYSVSGTVYEDTNNPNLDAIDATDSPIPGVSLTIYGADDASFSNPLATATTDVNGFYEFTDLPDGDYVVVQTQPSDFGSVTDADGVDDNQIAVTINGANETNNDFLEQEIVALGSTIFADADNNGIQDPTESGISGVAVELYSPGGNGVVGGGDDVLIDSTTTDSNGNYLFDSLPEGDYYVSIPDTNFNSGQPLENTPISSTTTSTADDGVDGDDNGIQSGIRTTTVSPIVNLTANSEPIDSGTETAVGNSLDNATDDADGDMTVDFGFVPVYSVSGTVYEDTNNPGDDTIESSDRTIPGVEIAIYELNGSPLPIAVITTDVNGFYEFTDLPDGDYVILQTQPTDYDSVADSDPSTADNRIDITVAGANSTENNFLEEKVVSLGSTVFADANDNGVQDPTESGIANVTVELYDPGADGIVGGTDDVLVATQTTDSSGNYLFTNLPEGNYYASIPSSNFTSGGALENSPVSSVNTATTDDGVDGDDNGIQIGGVATEVVSPVINLTANNEPVDTGTETAVGNTADNATDDADGDLTVDFGFVPKNTINGDGSPNNITGTASHDYIVGGKGEDTITGGAGQDCFFFNETSDGIDTILDFQPGEDKLDLSQILATEVSGYSGGDPFALGYVELVELTIGSTTSTVVQVDFDGGDESTPSDLYHKDIAFLEGVALSSLDSSRDFIF